MPILCESDSPSGDEKPQFKQKLEDYSSALREKDKEIE